MNNEEDLQPTTPEQTVNPTQNPVEAVAVESTPATAEPIPTVETTPSVETAPVQETVLPAVESVEPTPAVATQAVETLEPIPTPAAASVDLTPVATQPAPQANVEADTKPISPWGYIEYQILFGIPIIGHIMMIVYSFTAKNINVKNFARAYLIMFVIAVVLLIIIFILFGALIMGNVNSGNFTTSLENY